MRATRNLSGKSERMTIRIDPNYNKGASDFGYAKGDFKLRAHFNGMIF